MFAVSAQFLDVLPTASGQRYGYVEAYQDGSLLTLPDGSTRLPLKVGGGNQVAVNGATPGVRRTLTLTLAKQAGLFALLAPTGVELKAFTAIRYPSGSTEVVPQGVFVVDSQGMDVTPSGDLTITAPDRWAEIQRARFLIPRASAGSLTLRAQIAALVTEVFPDLSVTDTGSSTATVGAQTWDRDRDKAIQDMLTSGGLDFYFDRNGNPVIRDVPTLQTAAVWAVNAGAGGVMVGANRQRDRQRTRNVVVITGTANDGTTPFTPAAAWDNNPSSPTFAGPGAGVGSVLDVPAVPAGRRQVPFFYSSPLIHSTLQGQSVAQTLLAKMTGLNSQVDATAVPNVALDDGDTVEVTFPRERRDLARVTELHLVDTLTVPLAWDGTPLQIGTRSTVADIPEA